MSTELYGLDLLRNPNKLEKKTEKKKKTSNNIIKKM